MSTLGIDFGTSNSALAVAESGRVRRIPVEGEAETLPTAVFFPASGGPMRIGAAATRALIDGDEGRYMRALKSVLGTELMHEERPIGGRRRSLSEVVTALIGVLKERAEARTGQRFDAVLSGRPVRFHPDPARDAGAEADLAVCYREAGFETVDFLPEPEAAAIASAGMGEGMGLVVDIGGGTSDFTVFDGAGPRVIASHGIRLGGTDFDHTVSMARAMPLLGLGGRLRREMGPGLLPVPRSPYVELSTWAAIPFLYTAETRRMVAGMVKLAEDRDAMARFAAVLDLELGHDVAFAVEAGKIAANGGEGRIDLGVVEPGLSVEVGDLGAMLGEARAVLGEAAREALRSAGVGAEEVRRVVLVGGSSLLGLVQEEVAGLCPNAALLKAEAFTAVVDGLALAARRP